MSELKNEILNSNYVPVSEIDPELVPSHVVLYLKNKSTIDKKIIVDPISLQQILLSNQNPSLRLIDSKAVFCLSPPSEEISCDGATNSVHCILAVDEYGLENSEDLSASLQLIVDGGEVVTGLVIDPIDFSEVPFLIEDGFEVVDGIKLSNGTGVPKRIEIITNTEHIKVYMWDNPTINQIDGNNRNHVGACLSAIDTNSSRYTLTVDDKGIYPGDNIYSGTISPPTPSLYLSFHIQWYSDMNMDMGTSNSRVFYIDNDNMQFSPDGSTWSVNLNTLQSSLLPNHMDESGFYELAIFPIAGLNDPSFEIISNEIYYPYSPIEEPEFVGETDFAFYSSGNRNLGRFRTLNFQLEGFRLEVDGPIPWRLMGSFNFYPLNLTGNVSDLIAAYNNGMGTFILSGDSFGVSELELTESNFRSIFQLSVQDGINYFHYRGTRGGVFRAGGDGMQDSFSITPQTPLKPWNN